jgi:hypothetical protein
MHADSLIHHISHLENSHNEMDRKIRAMEASYTDNLSIQEMKKKKLYIKEEIERCRQKLAEMLH